MNTTLLIMAAGIGSRFGGGLPPGGRPSRQHRCLYRVASAGLRHRGGRARQPSFGRTEAARCHRARVSQEPQDPDFGRGDECFG